MLTITTIVITHELNIDSLVKLIAQKKKSMGDEKKLTIKVEVGKLFDDNFVKGNRFQTWVTNLVLVKKSTSKWRIRVDYRETCLKDSYPIPRMDQLIDVTYGHKLLSFMNVYLNYTQVKMSEQDAWRMNFYAYNEIYHHTMMPLVLLKR